MKSDITAEQSRKIRNMGIVCAMLVVGIHITWASVDSVWGRALDVYLRNGVARIAVPYFFLASGFFLPKHCAEPNWYRSVLIKRIRTLVVPYVFWLVVATIVSLPLPMIADMIAHRPFGSSIFFFHEPLVKVLGFDLQKGPSCLGPLWYVRCLCLFVLMSPILNLWVERLGGVWLLLCFGLTIAHHSWVPEGRWLWNVFEYGFSLSGVFYFSLGLFLRKREYALSKVTCTIISILMLSLHGLWGSFPIDWTTLAIPFMMYAVWAFMPTFEWPKWLTDSAFPVYLMHMLLIPYWSVLIQHTPLSDTTLGNIVVCLFAIAGSITLAVLLGRFFPRMAAIAFGGRCPYVIYYKKTDKSLS